MLDATYNIMKGNKKENKQMTQLIRWFLKLSNRKFNSILIWNSPFLGDFSRHAVECQINTYNNEIETIDDATYVRKL